MIARLALLGLVALMPGVAIAAGGETPSATDLLIALLNLAIILGIVFWFARKPIQEYFRLRRDTIQGDIEEASARLKRAEEDHARWQRQLAELDGEIERIHVSARERAAAERDRMIADAQAAAERIRADARIAVDQELRRAREALRDEASDLAIQLAGEMLRSQVSDGDRDRLVDEFIGEIEQGREA